MQYGEYTADLSENIVNAVDAVDIIDVKDIAEMDRAITGVKKQNRTCYTNFYISREDWDDYINAGTVSMVASTGSVLVFRKKPRFYVLYFFISDIKDFSLIMRRIFQAKNRNYVTDIVYKNNCFAEIIGVLQSNGFIKRVIYERMVLKQKYAYKETSFSGLVHAQLSDVDGIYELMYNNFDEFSDQLPSKNEISKAINSDKNDIIILKNNSGLILNMFWFVKQGKTVHWRYWIIHPEFRGKGLGTKLVVQALSRYSEAERVILWVRDNNPRAIALHKKLGFVSDNLTDCVMCLLQDNEITADYRC